MADSCLPVIGVPVSAEGVGRHYGGRQDGGRQDGGRHDGADKDGGVLDGWLIHDTDTADVPGVTVRAVPLMMTDDDATARMVRAALELAQ
jgi:LPPG:FO 2-phospho-L-lactate transferase